MPRSDQERYNEMKADVDNRSYEWFFFCDSDMTGPNKTFVAVVDRLSDLPPMGPSITNSHVDHRGEPEREFMGVPLRFVNKSIPKHAINCIHFVATSPQSTVWLRHAYSIIEQKQLGGTPPLLAVCIHRAVRREGGNMITVGIDAVVLTDVIAYYEHPSNSRLLQAMQGSEPPEWSAVMFAGQPADIAKPLHVMFHRMDQMYEAYDTGNIDYETHRRDIGNFFIEDLKNGSS